MPVEIASVPALPSPFLFPFPVKSLFFFDLFAGMSGLHEAMRRLDILDSEGVAVIMFETDGSCRKTFLKFAPASSLLSPFADCEQAIGSVFWLTEGGLETVLSSLPDLVVVSFFAGSPCVGFSEAKKFSKGIDDPESAKMWSVPVVIARTKAHFAALRPARNVPALVVLENVFMRADRKAAVTRCMRIEPIEIDARLLSACARPRLFWQNFTSYPPIPSPVSSASVLESGWLPL